MNWLKRALQRWLEIRPKSVTFVHGVNLDDTYFSEHTKALLRKSEASSHKIEQMLRGSANG